MIWTRELARERTYEEAKIFETELGVINEDRMLRVGNLFDKNKEKSTHRKRKRRYRQKWSKRQSTKTSKDSKKSWWVTKTASAKSLKASKKSAAKSSKSSEEIYTNSPKTESYTKSPKTSKTSSKSSKLFKIVHIGDSYSAGTGAGDEGEREECFRSENNWGLFVSNSIEDDLSVPVSYTNRACIGAYMNH